MVRGHRPRRRRRCGNGRDRHRSDGGNPHGDRDRPGPLRAHALRAGSGQAVANVQSRRTTAGVSQVRSGVLTSAGWQYSAWSAVATGAVTVKVDWTSAAAGGVVLTVNGTRIGAVTGNTSGSTVESAAFGLVATSGANTGAGALDSYTANR